MGAANCRPPTCSATCARDSCRNACRTFDNDKLLSQSDHRFKAGGSFAEEMAVGLNPTAPPPQDKENMDPMQDRPFLRGESTPLKIKPSMLVQDPPPPPSLFEADGFNANGFAGMWTEEARPGKSWTEIKDGRVTFSSGLVSEFRATGFESCTFEMDGQTISAQLAGCRLKLSNGGVWVRREDVSSVSQMAMQGAEHLPEVEVPSVNPADLVEMDETQAPDLGHGAKYKGQWYNEMRHGHGELCRSDGSKYTGNFALNQAHGHGEYLSANGSSYNGQWYLGRAHGLGKYVSPDGSVYEGEWQLDQKSGKGHETWPDGTTYEGDFCRGHKHGIGSYKSKRSGIEYVGEFRADKMDGNGEYKGSDGRIYVGQWVRGVKSGHGKMDWPNGAMYDGDYENDLKHGVGVFTWPDGRTYSGQWRKGRQDGTGVAKDTAGVSTRCEWRAGKMVGKDDSDNMSVTTGSKAPSEHSPRSITAPAW